MNKVYKLSFDTNRVGGSDYDAVFLRTNEKSNNIPYYFSNPNLYDIDCLPPKLYFEANFHCIPQYDIPFTDTTIFIVSKKVENIFKQYSDVSFFKVPVIMLDESISIERFNKNGELEEGNHINCDYVALRFSELKSYFDLQNSEYRPLRSNPDGVGIVKRLILKEPKEGFPSIFRTIEKSSIIFVADLVKQAFEKNNIKGCLFEEVEVNLYSG